MKLSPDDFYLLLQLAGKLSYRDIRLRAEGRSGVVADKIREMVDADAIAILKALESFLDKQMEELV